MNIGSTAERDTDTTGVVPTYTSRPKGDETAKEHILNEYPDVFDGIGCFEGEYHITLDPTVPPVVHYPCRVPVALREPHKEELDNLIQHGIIAKVDRPTDWVNSCVCVTKPNGKLRLCLDPKDLKKKKDHTTTHQHSTMYFRCSMGHSSSLSSTPEVDTGTLSWTKKVPTTQHSTLLTDDTDS